MTLNFKGTTNDYDIWVKSIVFQLADGQEVTVNRNITRYIIDHGQLEMKWIGCYIPGGKRGNIYQIKPADFNKAEIVMLNIDEEYAPKNYMIHISEWKASD